MIFKCFKKLGATFFLLLEETGEVLGGVLGDADASRADKLEDVVAGEHVVERLGLAFVTGFLDNGVVARKLEDAGVVHADDFFEILLVEELVGGHFVERYLLVDDFVVGVEIGVEHVDAAVDLQYHLLHGLAVGGAGEVHLVDAVDGAGARRHALEVETAAGEYDGDAVEQAYLVFGENRYGEKLLFHKREILGMGGCGVSRGSGCRR